MDGTWGGAVTGKSGPWIPIDPECERVALSFGVSGFDLVDPSLNSIRDIKDNKRR